MRYYPVISAIIAIHIILFLGVNVSEELRLLLRGVNVYITEAGEYWRLITPIFVHIGLMHFIFNSFSLILFGPALEVMLGKTKFILAYLTTGILANVATLFLAGPWYAHVGASGAIFGLFGIYLYLLFMRPELLDANSRQIIVLIVIFALLMTFLRTGINIYAHIFGLLAGLAMGPLLFTHFKR
nr:rhomboid family intramembrane serine protease [Alkalibacillus aidingensis]